MTRGIRIATLGGAPVILKASWFLVAAVLTALFLPTVRANAPSLGTGPALVAAAAFPILLFASVLVHELAHGAAARIVGVGVKEYVLTFAGGHTSFTGDLRTPGASAMVAVAGPMANLVLAAAGWALLPVIPPGILAILAVAVTWANAFVGIFNLLPGSPLDGGRILEALLWAATGDREQGLVGAGWVGRALAVVIGAGVLGWPILRGQQPSVTSAIWGLVIAGLIWQGASRSIQLGRARRGARSFDLRAFVRPASVVSSSATVAQLPPAPWGVAQAEVVVVDGAGIPIGLLDRAALARVPPGDAARTPVMSVALALPPLAVIRATSGPEALGAVAAALRSAPVLVVLGEHGVLGTADVAALVGALRSPGQ